MYHIHHSEATIFTVPGFEIRVLTAPSHGAAEVCTWHLYATPHASSESHMLDHQELFIGQSGQLTVTVAGERVVLLPGDAILVPAGALMQLANESDAPAHVIGCVTAGFQAKGASGEPIGAPWAQ